MTRRTAQLLAPWLLLVAGPWPGLALDLGDGRVRLKAEIYDRASGPGEAPGGFHFSRLAPGEVEGWVVAIRGPADEAARGAIEAAGGRIVGYVPSNAYLVRAPARAAANLRGAGAVERVDRYRPAWKVARDLSRPEARSGHDEILHVEIFEGESPARVADRARALGVEVVRVHDRAGIRRLEVRCPHELLPALARLTEVEWIEPRPRISVRNDQVRWVIQSNVAQRSPLTVRGLQGEGQVIGHIDFPIAHLSCYFRDPVDPNPGPNHRKLVAYRRQAGFGADPHGTHTAGTAAGDAEPLTGSTANRGIAPLARISHADVREITIIPSNLGTFFENAHNDGARVHTNSWGDDSQTSYTTLARDIDLFSRDHEDDLIVFAVSNRNTVHTPENAKNALAVGASRREPNQGSHWFGGTGPTIDGRRKPEVYAPGEATESAAISSCAVVANSGTSMAAPAVAGGAVLIREYFLDGLYPSGRRRAEDSFTPTGALVKAMIVGATVDMEGVLGYPSDREGWGRVLLADTVYFFGDPKQLWLTDVRHAQGLDTGQSAVWNLEIVDDTVPLGVTMVFADAPASVGAAFAPVNDLDLEVEGPSGLFLGNVFDAAVGASVAGGTADPLNNVERVIVPSPGPGQWTIRVRAPDVPIGPQGFAIVATGRMPGPVREPDRQPTTRFASFALERPFPNPFSSEVSIRYVVPERSSVHLSVLDLRGRLVRVLVDRVVSGGVLTEKWDGTDELGRRVAAGIYVTRMEAPGFSQSAKTVFLH